MGYISTIYSYNEPMVVQSEISSAESPESVTIKLSVQPRPLSQYVISQLFCHNADFFQNIL